MTRWVTTIGTGVPSWWSQIGFTQDLPVMVSGIWFTHRIIVDLENDLAQIRVTSPQLGIDKTYTELGLCTKESKTPETINKLFFDTQTGDGKMVFDYIKVESNPEDLPGADEYIHPEELIEPVYCETPTEHPKQNGINIMVDGKYKYTATPLFIDSNATMIYFKNFAQITGGKINDNLSVTVNNTVMEFFENSAYCRVNGVDNDMSIKTVDLNGKLFVPLRFVAESSGYNVGWDSETRTVTLERK